MNPIRRLYNAVVTLSTHRHAEAALLGVSFAESSVFPIPPDAMLVPMMLNNRAKIWRYAAICTAGSVAGALLGYAVGSVLYHTVGEPLIALYGLTEKAQHFQALYHQYGAWVIVLKGVTPIPFKLVTIASGMAHFPLLEFVVLCALTRGARFFALGALIHWQGETMLATLEKRLELISILFVAALVAGIALTLWLA